MFCFVDINCHLTIKWEDELCTDSFLSSLEDLKKNYILIRLIAFFLHTSYFIILVLLVSDFSNVYTSWRWNFLIFIFCLLKLKFLLQID